MMGTAVTAQNAVAMIQKKSEPGSRSAGESDHSVRLEVHGRVRLDMVAFVNGTCQIDRVIFIPMDAEDLLRARLDLANIIHQLPAIGVTREPIDSNDLQIDGDGSFSSHRHFTPAFLDAPAVGPVSLVPDKDEGVLLILCKV